MRNDNFQATIIDKHKNHDGILAIKEEHNKDVSGFDLRPVDAIYVQTLFDQLHINKTTGYD